MNKICQIASVLFLLMVGICVNAEAKMTIFGQPRFVPDVGFYDDAGKLYKPKDLDADLSVIIIWSKTCGPCLAELRTLDRFVEKTKNKGIKVVLVSPEDEWRDAQQRKTFLNRFGVKKVDDFVDRNNMFMNGLAVMSIPSAILADKKGYEVGRVTGAVEWDNPKVIRYFINLKNDLK